VERINLFGNTVSDLENIMLEIGEKPYHARQLFKWLYKLGED
jgi:adenine C2-methylase RlmN of 23S rRNA A2503 and tRNA A37